MKQTPADEQDLTRYLLGQLPRAEQEAVELRYLEDAEFHDQVRAAERDLIDRYVDGELADTEAFERHFLSSPGRRQRVEFSRALKQSLNQAASRAEAAGAPRRRRMGWPLSQSDRSLPAWQLAAASVVVFVAGALIALTWQRQNRPREVPRTAQQQPGPDQPAVPAGPANQTPPGSTPAPTARFATLVLTPTLTRGADDTTPTVTVDGDIRVRLELHFDAAGYTRYRAVVRTADGADVFNQDRLQVERTAAGPAVVLTLPAALLTAEDYTVRVSGIARDGEADDVAGYVFKVLRRPIGPR